jgi:hypothetical protein
MSVLRANRFQTLTGQTVQTVLQMASTGETYRSFNTTDATMPFTGLSISLTPLFSTSRILVIASLMYRQAGGSGGSKTQIRRSIGGGAYNTVWGTTGNLAGFYSDTSLANFHYPYHYSFVDSPATTSLVDYRVHFGPYINGNDYNFGNNSNHPLCLTIMEIAQ